MNVNTTKIPNRVDKTKASKYNIEKKQNKIEQPETRRFDKVFSKRQASLVSCVTTKVKFPFTKSVYVAEIQSKNVLGSDTISQIFGLFNVSVSEHQLLYL